MVCRVLVCIRQNSGHESKSAEDEQVYEQALDLSKALRL
jgi:hypothetical protein